MKAVVVALLLATPLIVTGADFATWAFVFGGAGLVVAGAGAFGTPKNETRR